MGQRESARARRRELRKLTKGWEFRSCYADGRRIASRHAVVFYHAGEKPAERRGVRVGVVASRRIGGAVQRNRAKRLLRETARRLAHRWIDRNIWVVLVARASIVEQDARRVHDDIEQVLIAQGLLGPDRH